jgi:hypothetical protein
MQFFFVIIAPIDCRQARNELDGRSLECRVVSAISVGHRVIVKTYRG